VTSPKPPETFDDGMIGDLFWNCIDADVFSEPDNLGGSASGDEIATSTTAGKAPRGSTVMSHAGRRTSF